jgi:hypothetical protein
LDTVAQRAAAGGLGPSDADLHRVRHEEEGTLDLREGARAVVGAKLDEERARRKASGWDQIQRRCAV